MKNFLYHVHIFFSRVAKFFSSEKHLHNARFAKPHELESLSSNTLDGLLLGVDHFHRALRVQTTEERRELGNVLVNAPTRGGKGLLAISQILTWPHSIIINDIKGELFRLTAGHRNMFGPVYVFDPDGYGHQYDPLLGRLSNRDLISSATDLLDHTSDQEIIFAQRAIVMLTQLFLAARLEERSLLPSVQQMINLGLLGVATKLEMLSRLHTMQPNLATKFLDVDISHADFKDKFLLSCWGTLKARMELLLADPTVRCFNKPDFTGKGIITSKTPITVYLRWPERDLHALSPLIRLIWKSLIDEMMDTYDDQNGEGCYPVLLLVDEGGRSAIPSLADHATTVNGRGISLWIAIQSLSQLDAVYGRSRAQILRDNMDSQIYYRPCNQETAEYLQKCLGDKSGFAHSENSHNGVEDSRGLSEREVPLMTAQEIKQMRDEEIIGFHRGLPPFQAKRMDWRRFPLLQQRRSIPPPTLSALPALKEQLPDPAQHTPSPVVSWRPEPGLLLWESPSPMANGLRKNTPGGGEGWA